MSALPFLNLCPGCFADKGDSAVCPSCGYDESVPRGVLVLPHRTVLNKQYLIGSILGKLGGFGITYLAWDMHLETPVAIKEYLPRELAGRDSNHLTITAHSRDDQALFLIGLELFLKEARTLAKFDHENIVRVRNVLEENGTAYLVMNFYEGTTLAAHLEHKGGRLPENVAISIMLPLLDGLREVHAKGFLHRDIKPQNVYLTKSGIPILLDFGSARMVMGERTRSMTVLMTPGYAPFEQYHRKGQQGPWTDIYACGATLYHMITGVVPKEATERAEQDTLQSPAKLVPSLSPAVSNIVMQAMAMNREARPSTVTEFMDALAQTKENRIPIAKGNSPEEKNKAPEPPNTQPEAQEQTISLSPYFKAALGRRNATYYLTRFAKFDLNWGELLKPTWNAAGFIFNAFWLLYRGIFGFGVLFFLMPIVSMTLADSKMTGLWCWLVLSFAIGCYGNALYFLNISHRISKIEQKFPGSRLHPLKLSRLASAGDVNLRIPMVYFFIALVAIYSHGQFYTWVSTKAGGNVNHTPRPPTKLSSEQEKQYQNDELPNENTEVKPSYDASQYKQISDELLKIADWPALLQHSKKWSSLDRLNPDAWLAFGLANFELAQFSLAQPAFETYFRLKPEDNDYVLGYLAKTYIKLKKRGAAEQALLKVIALRSKFNRPKSSDDALYYYELGNIYFLSNERKQEASQLYKQALEIQPLNEIFKSSVDAALKALARQQGNPLTEKDGSELPVTDLNESLNNSNAWLNGNYTSDLKQRAYGSLSAAVAAGDIQAVQRLLNKGADVNKSETGSYPLIQAVKHRQSEMAAFLLKNGADINAEDGNGNKAIVYSIVNGDKKTMDILTNAGAFHGLR